MTLTDYIREKVLHDLSLLKSETTNPVEKIGCMKAIEQISVFNKERAV